MTLPANGVLATIDVLAKRELSIEELEAIAAGLAMNSTPAQILAALHYHPPHHTPPRYWMSAGTAPF